MSCDRKSRLQGDEREEEAVDGLSEEQKQRMRQRKKEKRRQQQKAHKNKYLPLLKFLKKHGLTFKSAVVGKHTIEYFRMDNFIALLEVKQKEIKADKKVKKLLQNWEKIFLFYQRLPNQPKFRFPDELQQSQYGVQSKFASFRFNSSESSSLVTGVILLSVVGVVLFPLWPYEVKYFLFKAISYLLIGILAVTVLRLLLHIFMTIFGVDFWLLPNFFKNDTTWETFFPVFSAKKMKGSLESTAIRLVLLGLFFYYSYHVIQDPSIFEKNWERAGRVLDDIDEWGVAKLKGEKNFSQSALEGYSQMYNKTVEEELVS